MKSKLALIAVLALGILVGGTTVALAANGSAGSAQYAPEEDDSDLCVEEGSGSAGSESGNGCEHPCVEEGSGSAGESGDSSSGSGENCVHQETKPAPPAQNLPYTGFSAIPMLLIGGGLLGGGLLIRRRFSGHLPTA